MFYDDFFSELYKNKVRYLLGGGHAVDIFLKPLMNFDEMFERKKIIKYSDFEIYVI